MGSDQIFRHAIMTCAAAITEKSDLTPFSKNLI